MRRLWVVVALTAGVAAGVALNACGGDSTPEVSIPPPTTTSETLSKSAFISEADARCKEANNSIGQLAAEGKGLSGASEIADTRQGVLDALRELGPPSEDRSTLDDFLTAYENQVTAGEKIGLALQRNEDTSRFEDELQQAQDDAATAADTYGFRECGKEPTPSSSTTSSSAPSAVAPSAPSTAAPSAPAVTPSTTPSTGGGTSGGTGGGTGTTGGTGGGGIGVP